MANKNKRTTLDALKLKEQVLQAAPIKTKVPSVLKSNQSAIVVENQSERTKGKIAKTTVYAPEAVFEQWRELAFTERKKMHDYLMEGLDLVFKDRGLKSIAELTTKK